MAQMILNKKKKLDIFDNAEKLYNKVEAYFYDCDHWGDKKKGLDKNKPKPYTLAGLCFYLRCSHSMLHHYESSEEFGETIQYAKMRIEAYIEELSLTTRFAAGPIFNLKARFGLQEVEVEKHQNPIQVVISAAEEGLFKRKDPVLVEETITAADKVIEITPSA